MLDSDLCFVGFILFLVIAAMLFPGGPGTPRRLRVGTWPRSAITKLYFLTMQAQARVYLCKRGPVWLRWPTWYVVVAAL